MTENSSGSKRRIKIPEIEREYWRRVFFDDVHSRKRVQNVIEQDLRSLIRASVQRIHGSASPGILSLLNDLPNHALLGRGAAGYEDQLAAVVGESLRCRHNGKPAYWMVAYLDRAARHDMPPGPFLPDPDEEPVADVKGDGSRKRLRLTPDVDRDAVFEMLLILRIGPYGASIQSESADTSRWPWHYVQDVDQAFSDDTGRWDDWHRYEERAIAILKDGLRRTRHAYEEYSPQRANSKPDAERLEQAKELASYLVDQQPLPPDRALRMRLKRFADLIGLDFPVR